MRDVAFFFRKKTGFPKLSDSGLADAVLGGEGMTATVHISSAAKDKSSVFKVKNVIVKLDSLAFSIRDSKHDLLYKTLKPLATGLVKKQIQKAVADAITTGLEYVDGQLVGVRDRMADAKATEGESRTKVLQEIFHRKKAEAQATKDSKNAEVRVLVDASSPTSVLPGVGHGSGIGNKAAERSSAAQKGNDWRSEAFHIVHPSTTSGTGTGTGTGIGNNSARMGDVSGANTARTSNVSGTTANTRV